MDTDADLLARLLRSRRSVRDFRPDPLDARVLEAVLADAVRAPSWSNTQPYRLAVAEGAVRDRLRDDLCARYDAALHLRDGGPVDKLRALLRGVRPDGDFDARVTYPDALQPRRRAAGTGLYQTLGIARDDLRRRDVQMRRNFEFFGAPVVVFVFVHARMGVWSVLDAGLMVQSLLLSAHARGLGACAQGALAVWAGPVRAAFQVPADHKLLLGISLGHPSEAAVNAFDPGRAPLAELLVPAR